MTKQLPGLIVQAKNYIIAYTKWVAAGKPLRTPQAIAELFVICENCPSMNFIPISDGIGRCAECACWLRKDSRDRNKLAWPTSPCPDGHFQNEVEEEPDGESE
jgi:hypothetical protein